MILTTLVLTPLGECHLLFDGFLICKPGYQKTLSYKVASILVDVCKIEWANLMYLLLWSQIHTPLHADLVH
jgi:hypothetical protein